MLVNNKSKFKPGPKPKGKRPPPASRPSSSNTPASTPAASQQEDANPTPPPPSAPTEAAPPAVDNAPPQDVETPSAQGQTQHSEVREPSPISTMTSAAGVSSIQSQDDAIPSQAETPASTAPLPTAVSPRHTRPTAPKPVRASKSAAVSVPPPAAPAPALTPAPTPSVPEQASSATSSSGASTISEAPHPEEATPNTEDVVASVEPVAEQPAEPTSGPSQPPEPSTSGPSQAPKPKPKPKPRVPRKRKADTAIEEPAAGTAENEEAGEANTSTPAPRKRARRRAAPLPGEEGYEAYQAAKAGRKHRQKRTKAAVAAEDGETPEGEETQSRANSRAPRAQREVTPENAEEQVVDEDEFKMADLAKDLRIGKKFSLHDTLLERERVKKLKANEKGKKGRVNGAEEGGENNDNDGQPQPLNADTPLLGGNDDDEGGFARPVAVTAPVGEQYQIIDGEIVLNQSSLQIDRHARAREAEGNLEEVEVNDFTNHTTQQTYLRRALKPGQWSDADTDQFYWALSRFGTDFELISKMFPGKTRKHIKLKFNREERQNPARVKSALVGEVKQPMRIEEVKEKTKQEFETTDDIEKELEEQRKEFEEREEAVEREKREEEKRKEEKMLKELEEAKKKSGRRGKKKVEQGVW
ncbi:uncharacterized protein QC764_707740 [Podospora pseudoanserina]|uniref:Myb-like domain-containing protein n=1 Tax=Podospora pseudoanserina TaxID=2609844 RepID=A0ABR0HK77_9PEZI|nr:hypothetical protein QC764_707740 [Podospora pseudoanserina]